MTGLDKKPFPGKCNAYLSHKNSAKKKRKKERTLLTCFNLPLGTLILEFLSLKEAIW